MIYRQKIRVKVPGDEHATAAKRKAVQELIAKHGGKDATGPNPRAHVVGVFGDKAAKRAFRDEARRLTQAPEGS